MGVRGGRGRGGGGRGGEVQAEGKGGMDRSTKGQKRGGREAG